LFNHGITMDDSKSSKVNDNKTNIIYLASPGYAKSLRILSL